MKESSQDKGGRIQKNYSESKQKQSVAPVASVAPKPFILRALYKLFKYGTFFTVLTIIVVSGLSFLGDTSQPINENREIFNLYKMDADSQGAVSEINSLLNKQSKKYLSENTVNLFLQQKQTGENSDSKFNDLLHFSDFFLSQKYTDKRVLRLPLNFNADQPEEMIPQALSSKLLYKLKIRVKKFLQKNKLLQESSTKQLSWSRFKRLIDNGKIQDIFSLLKENTINYLWSWINQKPDVIVLTFENQEIKKIGTENKKSFNKWIKQNDEDVQIFILSKNPINKYYDIDQEDHFKSHQAEISLKNFSTESFCKYFAQESNLNEAQCLILKIRFQKMSELESFVDKLGNQNLTLKSQKTDNEGEKILQKVCEKGQTTYYFYENQQDAYTSLIRNKKKNKPRFERQIEALIVKWSFLNRSIGLSKLKDVYLTLFGNKKSQKSLTLQQVNKLGLVYSFDLHQLHWRSDEQRISYEVKMGQTCKGGKSRQEEQLKETQNQDENKEEDEDEEAIEENEEDESSEQQQEYEQNYIKWDQKDRDHAFDNQEEVQLIDQEQDQPSQGTQSQKAEQSHEKVDPSAQEQSVQGQALQAQTQGQDATEQVTESDQAQQQQQIQGEQQNGQGQHVLQQNDEAQHQTNEKAQEKDQKSDYSADETQREQAEQTHNQPSQQIDDQREVQVEAQVQGEAQVQLQVKAQVEAQVSSQGEAQTETQVQELAQAEQSQQEQTQAQNQQQDGQQEEEQSQNDKSGTETSQTIHVQN